MTTIDVRFLTVLGAFVTLTTLAFNMCIPAEADPGAPQKTFIDYFEPTPITGQLSSTIWGAPAVGPRDPENGLEDQTMTKWNYWDGKILKGDDGKYYIFASRWPQANGHNGWWGSSAVEAVSDNLLGPYTDLGPLWPDNQGGKGHNVTALRLPDKTYAVVVSETRPGDVFTSKSITGPWQQIGSIQIAPGPYGDLGRMSNVSITLRPDGSFEIIPRSGAVWISKTGILGPYVIQGPSIYPNVSGLPQDNLGCFEDPCVWYSGGFYHLLVNNWYDRKAYHLVSKDGITGWNYEGAAYDPTANFVRYTDGTVNHWNKLERPNVYIEKGHVAAVTLAVIDFPKEQENGNDGHGSKVIVMPFDGKELDKDLSRSFGH
jgi:hypothetical protein